MNYYIQCECSYMRPKYAEEEENEHRWNACSHYPPASTRPRLACAKLSPPAPCREGHGEHALDRDSDVPA
jgi:hypothetical protein